jgi:ribokinase
LTNKISIPEVAVLGAAAVDWVARVKALPQVDGIAFAESYIPYPGGSGGNIAAGVARLGRPVEFLGVLGGDEGGRLLLEDFAQAGVDLRAVTIAPAGRSAATFIAIDERGERVIFALGGMALYEHSEDIRPESLAGVRMLVVADAYAHVAEAAFAALDPQARVVFNPGGLMSAAGAEYLAPILRRTDVWIGSHAEAETLTGLAAAENAAREIAARGPRTVILTLGRQGALVYQNGEMTPIPALPAEQVVDTTGAGDAFTSGVVAGMLEGLSWPAAARLGCAAAAIKIAHVGARGGLPDRQQVENLMEEHPWSQRT